MPKLNIDRQLIRDIADILHEKDLAEFEWSEGGVQLRIARAIAPTVFQSLAPAPAAQASAGPAGGGDAQSRQGDPDAHPGAVKSPMVGTVYVGPEPGQPAFVKVGDEVSQGQTLLIVEAMKTMNPIPAPRSGRVVRILVENEQPVEYGEVLLVIE